MPDIPKPPSKQLLHLVFGGELKDVASTGIQKSRQARHCRRLSELCHRLCGVEGKSAGHGRQCRDALLHRPSPPAARSGKRSVVALGGRMLGLRLGRSQFDRPDRTGIALAGRSACRGLSVRVRLPLALRLYRLASIAAAPAVASRLLAWRAQARQGKSGAAVRALRCDQAAASGWPFDLAARRQRRRNARGDSADPAHPRHELRRARYLGHRYVSRTRRATPAAGRGAPVHSARRAAICRPISRSLAARSGAVC